MSESEVATEEPIKISCPNCLDVLYLQRKLDLKGRTVEVQENACVALCYKNPPNIWSCPTRQWGEPGTRFDVGADEVRYKDTIGPGHVVQVRPGDYERESRFESATA